MEVYHGSNSNFKKLRIARNIVRSSSTMLNEGMGIYFSTDRNVAKSYGKYLYTLEINDKYFKDFREEKVCRQYVFNIVKYIFNKTGLDISRYLYIDCLVMYIKCGNLAINKIGKEISMLLDSNEKWYRLGEKEIENVYKILKEYDKKGLKVYMFEYHIPNIGIIKDVSEEVVKKEKLEAKSFGN